MTYRILVVAEDRKENYPLVALADQLISCAARVHVFLVKTETNAEQGTRSSLPFEGSVSPAGVDSVERLRDEIDAVARTNDSFILTAFGDDDFMASLQGVAQSLKTPLCACGNLVTLPSTVSSNQTPLPSIFGNENFRYTELADRGILSLDPSDGLLIVPANFGVPISEMDAMVEKCTDFLEKDQSSDGFLKASHSRAMIELQEQLAANSGICVIDPFSSVSKVMDRSTFTALMSDMQAAGVAAGVVPRISPTPFFTATSLSDIDSFINSMHAAGLQFPVIVKPCVACGVKGSHQHAIVYNREGLEHLQFEGLPACVQSYVNHGGVQYKIYVVGKKVFCRAEPSTPDIHPDQTPSGAVLLFDTLESLRSSMMKQDCQTANSQTSTEKRLQDFNSSIGGMCVGVIDGVQEMKGGPTGLDLHAVRVIAQFLKDELDLTIFGFDVVVEEQSGAHFVVDVNFFPSCRRIPGIEKTIRAALLDRILAHKQRSS